MKSYIFIENETSAAKTEREMRSWTHYFLEPEMRSTMLATSSSNLRLPALVVGSSRA